MSSASRAFCLLLGSALASAHTPLFAAVDEATQRAALVYNILSFTTWPAARTPRGDALVLCVRAGAAISEPALRLSGRRVRDTMTLSVQQLRPASAGPDTGCHAVVIDANAGAGVDAAPLLRMAGVPGTLLIVEESSDTGTDATGAAAVVLRRVDGRPVFDINLRVARASGLQFSSKLLRLAKVLRE